ncbi:putative methylthioadenosine nucleosidase [Helianthus anomalus]
MRNLSIQVKGMSIFDVFIVSDLAFHDRRIPIPGPDKYGLGRRKSFSTPNRVKELNLKVTKNGFRQTFYIFKNQNLYIRFCYFHDLKRKDDSF